MATVQLYAWYNAGGAVTNYAQALAEGVPTGHSARSDIMLGGNASEDLPPLWPSTLPESLGNITLTVPPPSFQGGTQSVSSGAGQFTWFAAPGQTYQIQYTGDLTQTNWTNLGPSFVATNANQTLSVLATNTQAYYRVLLLP
jgi:hypothetical protein